MPEPRLAFGDVDPFQNFAVRRPKPALELHVTRNTLPVRKLSSPVRSRSIPRDWTPTRAPQPGKIPATRVRRVLLACQGTEGQTEDASHVVAGLRVGRNAAKTL